MNVTRCETSLGGGNIKDIEEFEFLGTALPKYSGMKRKVSETAVTGKQAMEPIVRNSST